MNDIDVQCDWNFGGEPGIFFSDRVDFQFDSGGNVYLGHKFVEDLEFEDELVEDDDDSESITSDSGGGPRPGRQRRERRSRRKKERHWDGGCVHSKRI